MKINPASTSAGAKTYSLSNTHGDVMATVNADGLLTGTYITGPFGETLTGSQTPQNATADTTYGYVGRYQKITETSFATPMIQMGARAYIPELGRFMQIDPVEGGTLNNYVYAMDPVNQWDLSGKCVGPAMLVCIGLLVAVSVASASNNLRNNSKSPMNWVNMGLSVTGVGVWSAVPKQFPRSTLRIQTGAPKVAMNRVPVQARQAVTAIVQTGQSPFRMAPFANREGRLPTINSFNLSTIRYTEHDIRPVADPRARGLERIVSGDDGSIWYTADHYITFTRIR